MSCLVKGIEKPKDCLSCGCHKYVAQINSDYEYKCLLSGKQVPLNFEQLYFMCPLTSATDVAENVRQLIAQYESKITAIREAHEHVVSRYERIIVEQEQRIAQLTKQCENKEFEVKTDNA